MGTKNNPGSFDCYHNALPDEPMFILLARDPSAPDLVEDWATERQRQINKGFKPKSDQAMVDEAVQCSANMKHWRVVNNGVWREPASPPEQPAADPVTQEWQPIETAPRNGRDILVSCGFGEPTRIAFWDDARGGIWSLWPGRERLYYPRHWMPLPTVPDKESK